MNNKLHWLFLAFFTVLTFTVSNAQETATLAVIERDGDTGTALVLVDLQTGTETVVLDDSFINTKPALSPNSRYIAFASNRDGNADYDLYLLEIQTQQIQQLTDHSGYEFDLDWSNDGSQIAYVAEVATGWQIRTINVFDLTVSQLVDSESNLFYPVWSPDDSQIAYVWRSGTARMIYSFGLNEMESHLLAIVDAYVYLRWSPDGSRLAFRGPGTNISVLDIASGQVQQITNEVEVLDYTWVNNHQLFYSETFTASYVINSDGTGRIEVALPFPADEIAFELPKGATVPVMTLTPTPTATPTPAPTQTGGGGQIAYDGGCTRPDGTGMLSAICGLNISGGDTFYLTTGDDPALASGNRVASGECTQSHIPPEG
ncbi:MAG: PD40 domain-containing protein [Chloroflexi bacterium]|nr:PD40 domain-containing protein [Chloroflexota bacterium]